MSGNRGSRHRSVTLASAPRFCRVCDDSRSVRIVDFPGLAMHGGGEATCPHCSPEPGRAPIPIYAYPILIETPKGAA